MNEMLMLNQNDEQTIEKGKFERAKFLDQEIKTYANLAWQNWIDSAKLLKQMRDEKLYEALGYEKFEDYTKAELNIGERQAYTYMGVLEKQGEKFLREHADLGITKIALLNAVPSIEREAFAETNDLAGMTVAEVEALVKENDGKAEQISILENEVEEKENRLEEALEEVRRLEQELIEEQNKPTEVAVKEPSDDEKTEWKNEGFQQGVKAANAEAKERAKKREEAVKKELEQAVQKATEEMKKSLDEANENYKKAQIDAALAAEQLGAIQKEMTIKSSVEATRFTFYFDALLGDYAKIFESLEKLKEEDEEVFKRYLEGLKKFQQDIDEKTKGMI